MGFLHSNEMEDRVFSMDAGHSLITENSIKAMSSLSLHGYHIPCAHAIREPILFL